MSILDPSSWSESLLIIELDSPTTFGAATITFFVGSRSSVPLPSVPFQLTVASFACVESDAVGSLKAALSLAVVVTAASKNDTTIVGYTLISSSEGAFVEATNSHYVPVCQSDNSMATIAIQKCKSQYLFAYFNLQTTMRDRASHCCQHNRDQKCNAIYLIRTRALKHVCVWPRADVPRGLYQGTRSRQSA